MTGHTTYADYQCPTCKQIIQIEIPHECNFQICHKCKGTGMMGWRHAEACDWCNGTGEWTNLKEDRNDQRKLRILLRTYVRIRYRLSSCWIVLVGWSSGSELYDGVIEAALLAIPDLDKRVTFHMNVIDSFENEDWDTQEECLGRDEAFDIALRKLHPDWEIDG